MTTRLIEKCFEQESEEDYILITDRRMIIVVDPYMINIKDLEKHDGSGTIILRARRPAWGKGDLSKYVFTIPL